MNLKQTFDWLHDQSVVQGSVDAGYPSRNTSTQRLMLSSDLRLHALSGQTYRGKPVRVLSNVKPSRFQSLTVLSAEAVAS